MAATKSYKAVFIDALKQEIKQVQVQKLQDLQSLVGGYIEAVGLDSDLIMYINEEGLYSSPNVGYQIGPRVFCGNGVVVNCEEYQDVPEGVLGITRNIVKFWDNRTEDEKATTP